MAEEPVIYEVTLDADADIGAEFDGWLTQHVHDMLQLPGFLDANTLRPDMRAASAGSGTPAIRRIVRYTLASRTALERYFREYAARMRAEGLARFGGSLHADRRVLDTRGRELTGVDLSGDATRTDKPATLQCLNCGASLSGNYCANCGQQNHTYAAPLWSVINDFFGSHFGFDTKFFHSILPLLFRPGFLSREYSAGRRARYINPLRLYFFSSLLFFFIAWSFANPQFMRINDSGTSSKSKPTFSQPERQKIQNNRDLSAQQKKSILDDAKTQEPNSSSQNTSNDNNVNFTMFGRSVSMSKAEFTTRITHAFEASLPKLMFVFLPLVALLLKLFYIRSKRFYMEHLVFTLHNHAFVFIAMTLIVLDNILAKHVGWTAAALRYFNDIIGWYMAIYVFIAMRVYYRQSYIKTFIKYLLIGFIYWLMMLTTFIAGMVVIFTEVVAT